MNNDEHLKLLTGIAEEQGRQAEWMRNHERSDIEHFMTLATKKDLEGLASKEDVARLNNFVHTFTLGVQILTGGWRWLIYGFITIGAVAGGVLILKGWLIGFLGWIGFVHVQ